MFLVVVEFVEIYVIFHQVDSLGGFSFAEVALMYGLASAAFGLADGVVGHLDRLPFYLRTGQFDAFLLRPLSALGQLLTSDFSLRRIGRVTTGFVVLVIALTVVDIDWNPARVALLVVTPLAGAVVFSSVFVATSAIGFWLVEGMEFANAFTYGGNYVSSFPFNIFGTVMRRVLHLRHPGRLRRLPAHPRAARPRRPGRAARLAVLVRTAGGAAVGRRRRTALADRCPALRGSRLMTV